MASSNRSSYPDILKYMIGKSVAKHDMGEEKLVEEFVKGLYSIRNAIVHMDDKKKGELRKAFAKVSKTSWLICFWYSVCMADHLELDILNIGGFLSNNQNARHGLPNDLLG